MAASEHIRAKQCCSFEAFLCLIVFLINCASQCLRAGSLSISQRELNLKPVVRKYCVVMCKVCDDVLVLVRKDQSESVYFFGQNHFLTFTAKSDRLGHPWQRWPPLLNKIHWRWLPSPFARQEAFGCRLWYVFVEACAIWCSIVDQDDPDGPEVVGQCRLWVTMGYQHLFRCWRPTWQEVLGFPCCRVHQTII